MRCSHGEDDNPFVDCLVRQSSVRATDGRMEDDRDDDPFDDPVGETFHASSERWTSDCDAEEDDVASIETNASERRSGMRKFETTFSQYKIFDV